VTITGVLAAAGGADIAQIDADAMSVVAAATDNRALSRARSQGALIQSSFISPLFVAG
jgi:hypothetical protein